MTQVRYIQITLICYTPTVCAPVPSVAGVSPQEFFLSSTEPINPSLGLWPSASDADRLALSRTLLDMMAEGAFFADRNLRIRYANPAFLRMIGHIAEDDGLSMDTVYRNSGGL